MGTSPSVVSMVMKNRIPLLYHVTMTHGTSLEYSGDAHIVTNDDPLGENIDLTRSTTTQESILNSERRLWREMHDRLVDYALKLEAENEKLREEVIRLTKRQEG